MTIVQDPREAGAPSMPASALRHVAVDHSGTTAEIAECIVMLARDAPGEARSGPLQQILGIEARVDEGIHRAEDWLRMERRCVASGLNCPECRSALYELPDPRLLRYRCRAGHAFTARGLLSGQAAVRDQLLASLFGALTEEASLARRWLGRQRRRKHGSGPARTPRCMHWADGAPRETGVRLAGRAAAGPLITTARTSSA